MTKTYTFNRVEGITKALRSLSKEASAELRDASQRIASKVADDAAREAYREGGVAALVAPSIKASHDRIPAIRMGGTKKLPPRNVDGARRTGARQTIGDVIWGAEFGGQRRPTTMQFSPWRGSSTGAGYFLWPNVRENHDYIADEYGDALIRAIDDSAKGAR